MAVDVIANVIIELSAVVAVSAGSGGCFFCGVEIAGQMVSRDSGNFQQASRGSQAVSKVVDYVNLHYSEPLSLDDLADRFYVSKYHLSHEFHRQVGTSVYRYIQKKRLLIARQLLQQGKKPNEVYSVCGFGDYAGFYRAFKSEYGAAPREYASWVRRSQETER